MAVLAAVGRGAVRRRLPLAGRDPDAVARRLACDAYRATLERLRAARGAGRARSCRATAVRNRASGALAILDEDVAYVEALAAQGAGAPLPRGAKAAEQRRIHAENVAAVASG